MSEPAPSHPGFILRTAMIHRAISPVIMVVRGGISQSSLDKILGGHKDITPGIANKIAKVMGTTTQHWTDLQRAYDEFHSKKNQ